MAYTNINKSDEYFNTVTYAGNSTTTNAITGVNFQPDWVWIKGRTIAESHRIYDAVRGASNHISSNATVAQSSSFPLTSFDSDGFTIGSADGSVNGAYNYVSWNWKANGAGSSNTDGSITSTVSANTTSGFSIVTYTGNSTAGATVGHGLGATPKMIMVKNLSAAGSWIVYHSTLGATKYLVLNSTDAETTDVEGWNNTAPTSSVFSLGIGGAVNGSNNYVAYCFAEKKGFSKFGSYVGNGSADGTFIYTGFKPAFVLHKRTDTAGYSWLIHDNKRPDYNSTNLILEADTSNAEKNVYHMDLLSNGFKHRITSGSTNASGGTYIYMAFAESPLVSSTGVPCTAR